MSRLHELKAQKKLIEKEITKIEKKYPPKNIVQEIKDDYQKIEEFAKNKKHSVIIEEFQCIYSIYLYIYSHLGNNSISPEIDFDIQYLGKNTIVRELLNEEENAEEFIYFNFFQERISDWDEYIECQNLCQKLLDKIVSYQDQYPNINIKEYIR